MKLWQSLERTDQPKTKKQKTQAGDKYMGPFGAIKTEKVKRKKKE